MRRNIFQFLTILFSLNSWSQSYVDASGADRFSSTRALDDFNNLKNIIEEDEALIESIKGSMYYNEIFQESIIIFKGNSINEKVFLRYNSFKDEIEIGKNSHQKKATSALKKDLNIEAQIGNELFKAFPLNPHPINHFYRLQQIQKANNLFCYLGNNRYYNVQ